MSKSPFRGLTDPNGYDIEYVEFNSPVWAGMGYVAGITIAQTSPHPTDRARATFAEIVGENWRFVLGNYGAVLVSNANIKFIWTVAPEVGAGESEENQKSVSVPEALRHIAHTLHKKGFEAHKPNSMPMHPKDKEALDNLFEGKGEKETAPDPTAHFDVVDPPVPDVVESAPESGGEKMKKRRGRPPGTKNKAKA